MKYSAAKSLKSAASVVAVLPDGNPIGSGNPPGTGMGMGADPWIPSWTGNGFGYWYDAGLPG